MHKFGQKMPGDWLFKVVPWFIGITFVLTILGVIAFGALGVKFVAAMEDCTPALQSSTDGGTTQYSVGCKK